MYVNYVQVWCQHSVEYFPFLVYVIYRALFLCGLPEIFKYCGGLFGMERQAVHLLLSVLVYLLHELLR